MEIEDSADYTAAEIRAQQSELQEEQETELAAEQQTEDPSARIEEIQSRFTDQLLPVVHVTDSADAVLDRHDNHDFSDTRSHIFVSETEGAVGVSAREFIVAVTDPAGAFAEPETFDDVTATIHQLGLNPAAVAGAIHVAAEHGLNANPIVANHPAIAAELGTDLATSVEPNPEYELVDGQTQSERLGSERVGPLDAPSTEQPAPLDGTARADGVDVIYSRDESLQTFQATAYTDNGPQTFGTRLGEHVTIDSLTAQLAEAGIDSTPHIQDLSRLAVHVQETEGDFAVVGMRDGNANRLFVVTPNQNVTELFATQEYSPDGFDWGYEGSGPAEAANAILTKTHGPDAAADPATVRALSSHIVAHVPDTFSISGTTISRGIGNNPGTAQTVIGFSTQGPAIDTVTQQLNNPAVDRDLTLENDLGAELSI